MKITGVYKNLPSRKSFRADFRLHGETGLFPRYIRTYKSAYADYTSNGKCTGIYLYGYQEAMPERHYYCRDGSVEVSEIIEMYMTGEINRSTAAQEIEAVIAARLSGNN